VTIPNLAGTDFKTGTSTSLRTGTFIHLYRWKRTTLKNRRKKPLEAGWKTQSSENVL
jgi:hypothetical protein